MSRPGEAMVAVFDMDGVLVDSLPALYRCYSLFLQRFGLEGTAEEFARLNGPSLPEIVSYLKEKHGLEATGEELLLYYRDGLAEAYGEAPLVSGVKVLIASLIDRGVELALASSASREIITRVLESSGLVGVFTTIISGDDVTRAKPDPEIYRLVKERYQGKDLYVIEDSENGVRAARAAGLKTIRFQPDPEEDGEGIQGIFFTGRGMGEISSFIEDLLAKAEIVSLGLPMEFALVKERPDVGMRAMMEQVWREELMRRPSLFNGKVTSYRSHAVEDGQLRIQCFETDYKRVLAHLHGFNMGVSPLGVSGLIVDSEGATLIGRRGDVTEYPGWYELVPSGGLSGKTPEAQILEEFEEETGLTADLIHTITPFCLIHDKAHDVYDIGCEVLLNGAARSATNSEYTKILRAPPEGIDELIDDGPLVPVSATLLQAWRERRGREAVG
jgi:HAD superfamily hydrolase (TIGR01509 family)